MIKIGIDATRIRSGGAVAHLVGIIEAFEFNEFEISEIHIWSYKSLLDKLPNHNWLIKHGSSFLEKSMISQLYFQLLLIYHINTFLIIN